MNESLLGFEVLLRIKAGGIHAKALDMSSGHAHCRRR